MPLSAQEKQDIFRRVKAVLSKYSPPMVVTKDAPGVFELIGNKPVPYGYRKTIVPGMYFSSVITRADSVNFHFFPIYFNVPAFRKLAPDTLKCLKGKSCFHFRKAEQVVEKELDAMLRAGVRAWKKEGYMR